VTRFTWFDFTTWDHAPNEKISINPNAARCRRHQHHEKRSRQDRSFAHFENDVEQKLVALSTEANGAVALFPPVSGPAQGTLGLIPLSPPATFSPPASGSPVTRTYLIVLDTLFSSFGDFHQVREALKKLFKEEDDSGSEYALVALGRPTRVIQNLTRDPEAILAAVDSKELTGAITSSEHSNLAEQESELPEILESCPHPYNPRVAR
jgi:hypothetical protein